MDLKKKARNPRCSRCRNHGFMAEFRGHAGKCLFTACTCWKCSLITERTRILATQRRISRTETTENPRTGPTTPAGTGTPARPTTDPRKTALTGTDTRTPARTGTDPKRPDGIADRGPAHSSGEYVEAEKPQTNTYSGEVLAMPPHFQMFPSPPDSYVLPIFLVNLQPPPPGTVREPTGFPHLPPSVLAYPVGPGAPQTGSVPLCVSFSPIPWLQETCGPKPLHRPLSNRENDNGTEGSPSPFGHYSESQESDVIIVDDDSPIKDRA